VNQKERDVLARIYSAVHTVSTLTPKNPADIGAITYNLPIATKGSARIADAISNFGYGDLTLAGEYLDEAEEILARRPEPSGGGER
jgi:hypothetical protein